MTDRIQALTVILDHDMRDDDVQALIDAIRCMRHVGNVVATAPVGVDALVARSRMHQAIRKQILNALDSEQT